MVVSNIVENTELKQILFFIHAGILHFVGMVAKSLVRLEKEFDYLLIKTSSLVSVGTMY